MGVIGKKDSVSSSISSEASRVSVKAKKIFTSNHYLWASASFLIYTLLSILIRKEFGLETAYDISIKKNPLLGIGATLLLNYAVIPLLLMAYFYRRNNGKHNVFLVIAYFLILVGCFLDGLLPYIESDSLKENLVSAIVYPAVYLVGHRLVSLLAYAILKRKEGDSDYQIYLGFVLLAPFTAGVLLIGAIGYLFITGSGNSSNSSSSSYRSGYSALAYSLEVKKQVRQQLMSVGCRTVAIYYEDGWKLVDYWDNGCKLEQILGPDWRHTYFKTPEGKVYEITTNCLDEKKIYYFG